MTEEVQDSGAPVVTPINELVDKPRLADTPVSPEPTRTPEPKPQAPPADDGDKRFSGLLRETLDEREKRQRAERERDQYRAAWEEQQRKLAAEQDKDPAPDMFKDPNAYNAWVERQLDKRAQAIAQKHVQPIMQHVSETTLQLSEMRAEKALGEERWRRLNEWITKQPEELRDWFMTQPDPYWAAYEQYRQRTTFERLGNDDLETYEAKLREQIRQQVLAEARGPIDPPDDDIDETARPARQQAPRSFAASRSAQPRDEGGRWSGPKPLAEIEREKNQRHKR